MFDPHIFSPFAGQQWRALRLTEQTQHIQKMCDNLAPPQLVMQWIEAAHHPTRRTSAPKHLSHVATRAFSRALMAALRKPNSEQWGRDIRARVSSQNHPKSVDVESLLVGCAESGLHLLPDVWDYVRSRLEQNTPTDPKKNQWFVDFLRTERSPAHAHLAALKLMISNRMQPMFGALGGVVDFHKISTICRPQGNALLLALVPLQRVSAGNTPHAGLDHLLSENTPKSIVVETLRMECRRNMQHALTVYTSLMVYACENGHDLFGPIAVGHAHTMLARLVKNKKVRSTPDILWMRQHLHAAAQRMKLLNAVAPQTHNNCGRVRRM